MAQTLQTFNFTVFVHFVLALHFQLPYVLPGSHKSFRAWLLLLYYLLYKCSLVLLLFQTNKPDDDDDDDDDDLS